MTDGQNDLRCWACGLPARSVCTRSHDELDLALAYKNGWIEDPLHGATYTITKAVDGRTTRYYYGTGKGPNGNKH